MTEERKTRKKKDSLADSKTIVEDISMIAVDDNVKSEIRSIIQELLRAQEDLLVEAISEVCGCILAKVDARLDTYNESINGKISALEKRIVDFERELEEAEQYHRRQTLLLHGIKEQRSESTNELITQTIGSHLGISRDYISAQISRSHRLGPPHLNRTKPRPIIFKLLTHDAKTAIFFKKKLLAKTGLSITESLTKKRMTLLRNTKASANVVNAWTIDGKVYCVKADGKKKHISKESDIALV